MNMQIMASLDKTLYEGLSRLSIVTGIFVYLHMSDGGQIQQQDTISSLLSPPQHHHSVLEILLILHNVFS